MKVCYFGQFDSEYARNRVLIHALKLKGHNVELCRVSGENRSVYRYRSLVSKFRIRCRNADLLLLGTPGYYDIPVAKFTSTVNDIPLIFDAHASLYDTEVLDRQNVSPRSRRAKYYWLIDRIGCELADTVLVDTLETKDFFVSEIGASEGSIRAIPHGTDERVFYPRERVDTNSDSEDQIWFHGSYIPLQGIEYIVKAADLLEHRDVRFKIVGTGQTYDRVSRIINRLEINNVNRVNWIDYDNLPNEIAKSILCLGIFGTSEKAGRVVPNKVYEYIAMKMPVITGDSPAMRRLFEHRRHVYLCQQGDAEALVEAVETLLDDPELRGRVRERGYRRYMNYFATELVGNRLNEVLENPNG